jgi:formate dehydrogenase maturation protein FdhE
MLKWLNHYVKEFIDDRTEEVYRKVLLNNKRYLELTSQIIQVQQELQNNLPPQLQSLVNQYDEAEAEQDGIVISLMYRQGFFDGARARRLGKRRR